MEQALSHRTGLTDILSYETFSKYVLPDPSRPWTPIEVARLLPEYATARFEPGGKFNYCNTNYLLLGAMIENITGKPYRQVLQEKILSPISLGSTYVSQGPFGSGRNDVAHGYQKMNGYLP